MDQNQNLHGSRWITVKKRWVCWGGCLLFLVLGWILYGSFTASVAVKGLDVPTFSLEEAKAIDALKAEVIIEKKVELFFEGSNIQEPAYFVLENGWVERLWLPSFHIHYFPGAEPWVINQKSDEFMLFYTTRIIDGPSSDAKALSPVKSVSIRLDSGRSKTDNFPDAEMSYFIFRGEIPFGKASLVVVSEDEERLIPMRIVKID